MQKKLVLDSALRTYISKSIISLLHDFVKNIPTSEA
jgi:hypothetical protein